MIIQMIKQPNPEHDFFIPYLQPAKHSINEKIKSGELKQQDLILVVFVLPKEAEVLIGQDGAERILENPPLFIFYHINWSSSIVFLVK